MCIPERITDVKNRESNSLYLAGPTSTSLGDLLEMQILGNHLRNPQNGLGWGPATCVLTSPLADSYAHSGLRTIVVVN